MTATSGLRRCARTMPRGWRLRRSGFNPLVAEYTWDDEGRMTTVKYPTWAEAFSYSFDALGRPAGLTQGTTTWAWDVLYDEAGRMTRVRYP